MSQTSCSLAGSSYQAFAKSVEPERTSHRPYISLISRFTRATASSFVSGGSKRLCCHGRRPLPDHLPRERVEYDLAEAEKACPCCGARRVRIGAETSEQLDYRPASLFVFESVRPTYACTVCSRTADPADDPTPTITTAPLPPQPIDKWLPGPGLLAHVAVSKFADHLPLYRQ